MMAIADMVIKGGSAADIGTDHGYIPMYLLSEKICPSVILTDIAEGPIARAKANLDKYGLKADLRVGPGLEVISDSEVSTVIIAGMGGETIMDILGKGPIKSHSFKRIILQPRTFAGELRTWLTENGFRFIDYRICREKDLLCEVFAVEPGNAEYIESENISRFLLEKGDPLLIEYLQRRIEGKENILSQLKNAKKEDKTLVLKFENELKELKDALELKRKV